MILDLLRWYGAYIMAKPRMCIENVLPALRANQDGHASISYHEFAWLPGRT